MKKILISLAIAGLISGCSDQSSSPPENTASAPPPPPAPQQLTPMQKLFDPEMLGATVQYLEQLTGPPRNVSDDGLVRTYKVNSCEVNAYVTGGQNSSVSALRFPITPECDGDVGKIWSGESVMTSQLSFGKFNEMVGGNVLFYADCLSLCGNAADPVVYAHVEGPRANDFLEMMVEIPLVNDQAIEASNRWQAAMEAKEGEDWVVETGFNCEPTKYAAAAKQAFAALKPEAITIGRGVLPIQPCTQQTAAAAPVQMSANPNQLVVPQPASSCDYDYDKRLKKIGLIPKVEEIHGPEDEDFVGYACPYRITPPPGTPVQKGSVVRYRSAYESG